MKSGELLTTGTNHDDNMEVATNDLHATRKMIEDSEDQYRLLINSMHDHALFLLDLNGNIKSWNQGIERALGYQEHEFVGRHFSFIATPEDNLHGLPQKELETALNTGKAEDKRWRIKKDGSHIFAEGVLTLIKNDKGEPAGFAKIIRDITNKKEAEAALKESQHESDRIKRLYEAVTGNTLDLMYVFDLNYRFIFANEALLTMWGSTWDRAIGKGLLENGYEPWHAEMHEREIDQVAATKQPVRGEVSFPHATLGKRIYDYILVPVINYDGDVEAVAGTTRDITELKLAEEALKQSAEQFRTLTQSLPQLIWTADTSGNCDFFNQQWYDYTGSTPEQSYGNGWTQFIHDPNRERLYAKWRHSLQEGESIVSEFLLTAKDGNNQWFYILGNPIRDKTGTIIKWVGALTNIDAQKAVEERLEKSVRDRTKELQRSNEDLQQFAHVASHDLKEPVRKVRTFSWRLADEFGNLLPEKAKIYLAKIEKASERMYAMIDGVLKYSSFNATEQKVESVSLDKELQSIETDLEVIIQQKSARITYRDLPVIQGSPVLLHQLFYNLINNSLKFAKSDIKPLILVSSQQASESDVESQHLDAGKKYAKIILQDNGIGFAQNESERIFQTFSRLNPKDKYEGTGIGLALCKKIVERYGGAIYAEGEEGIGAKFTIILPAW